MNTSGTIPPRGTTGGVGGSGARVMAAVLGLVLMPGGSTEALAADAQTIASTVCAACHMADGNSVVPMFPKLAGMQREYLLKQLSDFVSGKRKNDVMSPQAANLTPADIQALAEYFSTQTATPGTTTDAALAERGKRIFADGNEDSGLPACAGCHRPDGHGTSIYPRLAGQHPDYITSQLKNFGSGERKNDQNRFMRVVGQRITEDEIKAVAEYISGLTPQQ